MFSAGIWAFHFGYDNNAYPSMEKAAQLINNTGCHTAYIMYIFWLPLFEIKLRTCTLQEHVCYHLVLVLLIGHLWYIDL